MRERKITFWRAWCLPKLALYATALFLAKFATYVAYLSFFEWLDSFSYLTNQKSANVSTMSNIGAFIGVPILGFLSDLTYGKRSPVTIISCILASLIYYLYTIDYY